MSIIDNFLIRAYPLRLLAVQRAHGEKRSWRVIGSRKICRQAKIGVCVLLRQGVQVGVIVCAALLDPAAASPSPAVVELRTGLGNIDIALSTARAPLTSANFLKYVDRHLYDGASFYRVVTSRNDHNPHSKVDLIQGGLQLDIPPLGYVAHETTLQTGLRHLAGTISLARDKPGTAGSEFFIELKPDPSADYGGLRNTDRQGFAAFGKVVGGMDVVRAIYAQATDAPEARPYYKGQMLRQPVIILTARRVAASQQ